MHYKVGFWDSDHGVSLHFIDAYFDQPGGQTVPTNVRDLSPFEHLTDLGTEGFFVTTGVGFAVGVVDLLGITTGTAFLVAVVDPSSLEEIKLMSIFETFLSLEIGIKNVATFPEIFPANLLVFEYPIVGDIKYIFVTSISPKFASIVRPDAVIFKVVIE